MATPQELDAAVRLAIQEEFLLGRRPSVASIASMLGRDAPDVEAAFDRLASGRALVRAEPHDVVAHFAVPAAQWWADIVFT